MTLLLPRQAGADPDGGEMPAHGSERPIRDAPATHPERDASLKVSQRSRKIALVEDDEDVLTVMAMLVRSLGHRVEMQAHDGSEVISAVIEGRIHPDVILMDYRMPVINGLQAAREILRHDPSLKVIIVTADDSVKADVTAAGFSYLQKPFSGQDLSKAIDDATHPT